MTRIRVVVEGQLDLAVATRLLAEQGATAIPTGVQGGRERIFRRLRDYNAAAKRELWFVLLDLDQDDCAPSLLQAHLPAPSDGMVLRVAVQEVESWLLADPGLARHIRVPVRQLPTAVESIAFPKRRLIEIVRTHCRTRSIRAAMLPRDRNATVGERYTNFMIDFVDNQWDPARAAARSDSLRRCIAALERLP